MSEGTSEASAAKKRKLGQRFRPEYCIEFPCLMKSTREHYAYWSIANKTCPFSTVVGINTHTTKQLKSAKSATYRALQNWTLIMLWEGEGGPLQEILISIDSKLKHRIHL
jgi:hypothetical protein